MFLIVSPAITDGGVSGVVELSRLMLQHLKMMSRHMAAVNRGAPDLIVMSFSLIL